MTLIDAVGRFLGPIMAENCRLIEGWPDDMVVIIHFGGREHETTLGAFKDLDRAYRQAAERNIKQAMMRRGRKVTGSLL
jgi:hypothetical protein